MGAAPSDLEDACLTPYVDFADIEGETAFAIRFATSRHLAALFPDDESFHVRKKKKIMNIIRFQTLQSQALEVNTTAVTGRVSLILG